MSKITEQPFHIRSNSTPSTSHPTVQRVEEVLHKQRAHVSSSRTTKFVCDGLRNLRDLFELIDELIRLPTNQQSLPPGQKKLVEGQLEDSLMLLDLIVNVRDSIVAMSEHVKDLYSSLRRKGNEALSTKNIHKLLKNCRRTLKQMNHKSVSRSVGGKDSSTLVKASEEARMSSISLLQSVVSFLSKPKQKGSRWSLVSKKRVACEESAMEEESAGMWLQASYDCIASKVADGAQVLEAQNCLESLDIKLESLESGLDCLYKRLIQNRVSLLNLLSL